MSHKQCICPTNNITTTATTFMVHMEKSDCRNCISPDALFTGS